ncbi:MAG: hypothetical protein KDA85_22890, partial [Planctomycetaceae bacterium]|nr:hypothetical protein [Planctomycetaceae bacterium]
LPTPIQPTSNPNNSGIRPLAWTFFRYTVAWWLAGATMLLTLDAVLSDLAHGDPHRFMQAIVQLGIATLTGMLLWSVVRRYQKTGNATSVT